MKLEWKNVKDNGHMTAKWDITYSLRYKLYDIPRILESQSNLKFDQDYREKLKIYDIKLMYYENITNKESNGT